MDQKKEVLTEHRRLKREGMLERIYYEAHLNRSLVCRFEIMSMYN